MLTEHPTIKKAIKPAHLEPVFRRTESEGRLDFNEERFRLVIDTEQDEPLATVTEKYTLVQNAELVSALDLAADQRGLQLEPENGYYREGKAYYDFRVPDRQIKVGRDPSPVDLTINLRNDYRGEGGLALLVGWFRLVCTNGLVIGEVASNRKRRHVGEIDVYQFVSQALDKAVGKFEAERIIAETMAEHPYNPLAWQNMGREAAETAVRTARAEGRQPDLHALILADTAERYHDDLSRAVQSNTREIGHNLWAVVQAVAEIATHRMQQRADGSPLSGGLNAAAETWATRQSNRVRQLVGATR